MNRKPQISLLLVLIINIIITSLHYTDNAIFIPKYPEPEWITVSGLYLTWIIMTLIGVGCYLLYEKKKFLSSYFCLGIYSLTGLSRVAHYFYGTISDFSVKMHIFIWSDFLAGLLVVGFVIYSGLILREWQKQKVYK
jgi:hypothetical protein